MAATRAWEQRNAELEAMVADLCASMKQTNQTHGSDHFSRSGEYRRFGEDEEEDPLAELKKLKETDGIRQYHQKFENIRTRLKLPEDYLMSVYLAGLRLETRRHIKMFQPQTVRDCFFLGKAYEKVHSKPPMTANWNPKSVNSMDYSRDRSALDRNTSPSMEAWRSGSSHSERSGDDRWFSEEDRKFREYLMLRNNDDDETWTETDWWYRSEKENPEDQVLNCEELVESEVATDPTETEHELVSQVVDSVSEVLLVHKMDSYVMEVEELSQKSTNGNGENVAHQLFDQMPLRVASKEKRIKHLKAWKFKFKPTLKRSKSMVVRFFSVEEIAWLTKDPKETILDSDMKEFKETMAACRETRVDQFKLVEEKESKPEVLNLKPTCLYHQIGHGEKERLGIKKKRKGFKSWMFKYKRGDKKLHTLIFSNNMRMVVFQQRGLLVYLQMRKAETSSDMLMFNGKYSLPRRAIGSKLDTGEIVLSNQERNELCTENKEEVKSCLDRPQASVLMEEEPDSVRVNEVKLENKQTWTKLKVKKHDNLSWKEDESGSICCILKLGGVAITCKNVLEKIYAENLEIMACRLRPAMMESSVPSKVIGRDGSKRHGRSEIFCEVDAFGNQESSKFQKFAVAFMDISTVAKTQGLGFVHVLHKDAVLDSKLGYLIGNMREEDQKQQGDSELLVIVLECVDAKGGVGMDKKLFHLSLRNHRVWDPGGCISGLSRFC